MAGRRSDADPRPQPAAANARDALPGAERARLSARVCARAAALPELDGAATLMLYASFRSEVGTTALFSWALTAGKTVCSPRILSLIHI